MVVSATDFASREIALCDPGDELTTVDKDGDSAWVAGTEAEALVSLWLQFLSLWVVPQYGALAAAFFLCGVTTTGFVETHFVAVAVEAGFSITAGGLAFSVLSACNGLSMVLFGHLADKVNRHALLGVIFVGRAGAYFLLAGALAPGRVGVLFAFAVLFGVFNYSVVPPVVSLVHSWVPGSVGFGVGVLLLFHSVGAAVGAWAGGAAYSTWGGYHQALYACAMLCLCAAGCCALMQWCAPHERLWRALATSDDSEEEEEEKEEEEVDGQQALHK